MDAGTHTPAMRKFYNVLFSPHYLCKLVPWPISTGIGPEVFAYISSDGNFTGDVPPTADQLEFYNKHGYYITAPDYILRPEVLESNFYAYRVTGDPKYLDRAASAVDSFNKFLKTPTGFAGIDDVNDVKTTKIDDTESFWFAEVLKYL
jgi:mannosyl-oligosaccharide alpha-1,2-mannosidase